MVIVLAKSLEEESLTQWTVWLIRCVKPFPDATDMELVVAVLALHWR